LYEDDHIAKLFLENKFSYAFIFDYILTLFFGKFELIKRLDKLS